MASPTTRFLNRIDFRNFIWGVLSSGLLILTACGGGGSSSSSSGSGSVVPTGCVHNIHMLDQSATPITEVDAAFAQSAPSTMQVALYFSYHNATVGTIYTCGTVGLVSSSNGTYIYQSTFTVSGTTSYPDGRCRFNDVVKGTVTVSVQPTAHIANVHVQGDDSLSTTLYSAPGNNCIAGTGPFDVNHDVAYPSY